MPIDNEFLEKIRPLYSREMGTEHVGPFIYSLIRMTRSKTVLEVGAGYTTPFILKALSDNVINHKREKELLSEDDVPNQEDSILLHDYYTAKNTRGPLLDVIDNYSHPNSSANQVKKITKKLGLESFLKFWEGDFKDLAQGYKKSKRKFDLVWFDCGGHREYTDFLELYWNLIDPNGGLLLLHSTLTNIAIREILGQLKLRQATKEFNDFELLSLLEPHKRMQNSITLVRKISEFKPKMYSRGP